MRNFETLFDAAQAVRNFTIDKPEGCPDAIFERLRTQSMDLVAWEQTLRAIYDADRGAGDADSVGPELMQIAAAALCVFAVSGFLVIGKDGTAARMRLALLRDAGEPAPEGMAWPDPENDPAKTFIPPPPEPPAL
ncbi:MAG: hypothetical protein E7773_10255 [Sphingomonas sp.]|uniref:hypothetical protein n=1 Tax=Sphingomonas sp. TaxID=28214 RepID=UPI001219C452|nr:hypothetical protein [Sphingomonas sp.]THD35720.1 MAG: hypothetical protein E7773_10255 [Sphingomonas sp.]